MLKHISHKDIPIFIDEDSRVLILGSFPSNKSREYGFYYSHPRNRFFSVLSRIYKEETPISIEDRKAFLQKHNIALYDVIYECDINQSEDSSIRNVTPIDLVSILKRHPNIKCIGVNGKKASSLFDKYLKNKIDIRVVYLPSTSPANAGVSVDDLTCKYKEVLLTQ